MKCEGKYIDPHIFQFSEKRIDTTVYPWRRKEIELWHITQWMWRFKTLGRKFSRVFLFCVSWHWKHVDLKSGREFRSHKISHSFTFSWGVTIHIKRCNWTVRIDSCYSTLLKVISKVFKDINLYSVYARLLYRSKSSYSYCFTVETSSLPGMLAATGNSCHFFYPRVWKCQCV